jgi:hypothetical protein
MRTPLTLLLMLLAMGWLLTGCESDSTAPDDPLPPVTGEDVAGQGGYLAAAMVEVAPLALQFSGKADETDGRYSYTFAAGDPIMGTVELYFALDGVPSGWDVADYGRAWADAEAPLLIQPVEDGVVWELSFTLESDIDRDTDTAVVSGDGHLLVGDYDGTFTVTGYAVAEGGAWPTDGELVFTNADHEATVTFDGDSTALVTVGEDSWELDLDTGTLTAP